MGGNVHKRFTHIPKSCVQQIRGCSETAQNKGDFNRMLELRKRNALAGVTPMGRDRRTCPRYSFTAEAEALDASSRARMTARTSDISRGGCYVDTFCPFPRNSSVKIRVLRDHESLIAQAKVVYSKLGMGMGLCFTSLEPDHKQMLDRWVGEFSG